MCIFQFAINSVRIEVSYREGMPSVHLWEPDYKSLVLFQTHFGFPGWNGWFHGIRRIEYIVNKTQVPAAD